MKLLTKAALELARRRAAFLLIPLERYLSVLATTKPDAEALARMTRKPPTRKKRP